MRENNDRTSVHVLSKFRLARKCILGLTRTLRIYLVNAIYGWHRNLKKLATFTSFHQMPSHIHIRHVHALHETNKKYNELAFSRVIIISPVSQQKF